MKVIIQRYKMDENQTTGTFTVINNEGWPIFTCPCIERGDRNNELSVSNVKAGTYDLVFEYSPRFDTGLYELYGVPGRSECKIHQANYWDQLNGCIALGAYLVNLNNDKYMDLASSVKTVNDFHRIMKGVERCKIEIINPL